jgi:hypothetical protein
MRRTGLRRPQTSRRSTTASVCLTLLTYESARLMTPSLVHSIIANVKPFLVSQITHLITQYSDEVTNANGKRVHGSPPVDIVR